MSATELQPPEPGLTDSERLLFIGQANQSAIEQVRTVEAHYTRRNLRVWPNKVDQLPHTLCVWWWMEGDRHRLKYYVNVVKDDGAPPQKQGFMDIYMDSQRCLMLQDYDWETAPKVRIGDHSITGQITQRQPCFPQVNPLGDLLFDLQITPVARNLLGLIRQGRNVALAGKVIEGDHELWELRAVTPDEGREWRIQVDPAFNFLVRRAWASPTTKERAAGGRVAESEARTFDEVEPGVFFPGEVAVKLPEEPNGSHHEILLRFTELRVNQPVSTAAFEFEFPENLTVIDSIAKVAHVWGLGEPAHTVHSLEEDAALTSKLVGSRVSTPSEAFDPLSVPQKQEFLGLPYYLWLLILVLPALAVTTIAVLYQKRKTRTSV